MAFPKDLIGRISKLTKTSRGERTPRNQRQLSEDKVVADYRDTARPTIPIHAAAYEGDNERLKHLLEEGVNVHTPDPKKNSVTALMIAASKGYFDVTRTLLLNGANIHHLDTNLRTALEYAVYQGSILIVYYLIRWGSNPNHTDKAGLAPIHYAANLGNLTILKLLIECGAKKFIDCQKLGTPLNIAKEKGHKDIVDYLTASADSTETSRTSLSVSPVNRKTSPGRRSPDNRNTSPGHSNRSPSHRSPVPPSAPPDYETVGGYLEGAVGGYDPGNRVNARPSAPSYHEVVNEFVPTAPSYDEVFEDPVQSVFGGYDSSAASLPVSGALLPPPTYEDVISSNGLYDVFPPPYHAVCMLTDTENSRGQHGQNGFSSDDLTKEFHDLMNFARDIKADMQADVVPVNIGLAEILVRTHVDRRSSIEHRFYLFKETGKKTYMESSRNNIDDVNEKMTVAEQEEYTLLVMFTGYMFEYDVCLKHYSICKNLDDEMDEIAEQEVMIISINLDNASTFLTEKRHMMGQIDKSLNEIEDKYKEIDKEVKNLDKLKEWNYMSHPVKIDVNHFLMKRAVKFTKANGKFREVRRMFWRKEIQIESLDSKYKDNIADGWFKTAEIGDKRNIQIYLDGGVDVNAANEDGLTALHIAAFKGHTDFVHELLTSGADINIETKEGTTVLYGAVKFRRTEVVKELLNRSTQIKDFSKELGRSPVQLACSRRHWDIVKLFINTNLMSVNDSFLVPSIGRTAFGRFTPLRYAAEEGNLEMVKYLISKGADVELVKDMYGNFRYEERIKQELKGRQNQGEPCTSDSTVNFLRAARNGDMNKVLPFLRGNIDVNACNDNGMTALHLAAKFDFKIVRVLMQYGANINAATKKGNTPLHVAALAGQTRTVKYLIETGAKINVQSDCGFTPLYMAAQEGHTEIVKYLLQNGANQTLSTTDGYTPLAVALQQGHQEAISVLLDENDYSGGDGYTPLAVALQQGHQETISVLLDENDYSGGDSGRLTESPDQISKAKATNVRMCHQGLLSRKHEWINKVQKAASRVWVSVHAVLDNQALKFYEPGVCGIRGDQVPYEPRISLINAKVGPADFYKKKKYVFYIQLENGGSFLFKTNSKESMDEWIQQIQQVIDQ